MRRSRHLRRGIYLLPTLFTVGNLLCGFSAIILAAAGAIGPAAGLVVLAAVLDGLDGRLARLTGTTSDFGMQFDSLADIVSFGVAPAVLVWHWALEPLHRVGWLACFVFVVCAAMRLARFNIQALQTARQDKRFFVGLPSPAAAGTLACVAFAYPFGPASRLFAAAAALGTVVLALLMLSRLRYRSLKELDLRNRRSYIWVLPLAALLVALASEPKLLLVSWLYVLSAPAAYLAGLLRRAGVPGMPAPREQPVEVVDEPAVR